MSFGQEDQRISERVRYEEREGVGIWIVDDLQAAMNSGELEDGESHYREVAGQDSMDGVVVVLEDTDNVGPEVLSHVENEWSQLADETEVSRTAYVSDGISRLAIANKNETTSGEVKAFKRVDEAVSWSSEA